MGRSLAEWDHLKNGTPGRSSSTGYPGVPMPPDEQLAHLQSPLELPQITAHSSDTGKKRKRPEHGEVIDLVGGAGDTDDNGLVNGISYQSIAAAYIYVQETGIA